jgi:hypothetical protein
MHAVLLFSVMAINLVSSEDGVDVFQKCYDERKQQCFQLCDKDPRGYFDSTFEPLLGPKVLKKKNYSWCQGRLEQ